MTTVPPKKTEIISILKRRNNSNENIGDLPGKVILNAGSTVATSLGGGSSINSQTLSEDSNRDDSDSDWDGFPVSFFLNLI